VVYNATDGVASGGGGGGEGCGLCTTHSRAFPRVLMFTLSKGPSKFLFGIFMRVETVPLGRDKRM